MRVQQPRRRVRTIWTQVLLIALIPVIAIVIVGGALSGYLINHGLRVSGFAGDVRVALEPISAFVTGVQEERRLTMLRSQSPELDAQRRRVDEATASLERTIDRLSERATGDLSVALAKLAEATHGIAATRAQIDGGVMPAWPAYHYYNDLLDLCGVAIQGIARSAADAEVGFEQMISYDLFKAAEAMARSHAMAVRAVGSGLDGPQFHELAHQLGMYHEQVESVVPRMTQAERERYAELKQTPSWKALVAGDDSLMTRGPKLAAASFDVPAWESSARQVSQGLMGLYVSHSQHSADLATARGRSTFVTSIIAGLAILVIAVLAVVVAYRLSRRMVQRLRLLRKETLDIAHRGLPRLVSTIRAGGPADVDKQATLLHYGGDEVGQVADAFNIAQRTAIAAAAQEAETRQGVRSVFLNIARRNQVIVHRQLEVLDQAERAVEDPEQLRVLFQLDHLATRSRRNAENLIILAGEQPGRQWTNPIALRDVVRGAIAETEQYTRVRAVELPEVSIVGSAVADIVHLIAELVENGTAFSGPNSVVEVRGHYADGGVLVEIEDQGLGIDEQLAAELNAMLSDPPDFDVMALSPQTSVGLFVVARLAARHGISVTLHETGFVGTLATVLIPASRVVLDANQLALHGGGA
jgi:signal transduction histidine kinase